MDTSSTQALNGRQISRLLDPRRSYGPMGREATSVTSSPRRVAPNSLFVSLPLKGGSEEGEVELAISRGASIVVSERPRNFSNQRILWLQVADAWQALNKLSAEFNGRPSSKLRLILVSSDSRASSLCGLIRQVLDRAGVPCALITTEVCELGPRVLPGLQDDQFAADHIQQLLAQAVRAGCDACVMEVVPAFFKQHQIEGLNPAVWVVDQRPDSSPSSQSALFRDTQRHLEGVSLKQTGAAKVIRFDSHAELEGASVRIELGFRSEAETRIRGVESRMSGSKFELFLGARSMQCRTAMIGRESVHGILASVAVAQSLQVPPVSIMEAVNRCEAPQGYLENINPSGEFGVFIDGASRSEDLKASLWNLRLVTRGRIILVIGGKGSMRPSEHAQTASLSAQICGSVIFTTDDPEKADASVIANAMHHSAGQVDVACDLEVVLNRTEAIRRAVALAAAGDAVLIAGKGRVGLQKYEDTIVPFDDREEALEALKDRRRRTLPAPESAPARATAPIDATGVPDTVWGDFFEPASMN